MAVAIDLEDAYNRVQFKLLMDLVMQYGASLTLTRRIAGALLERTVVVCSLETGALLFICSEWAYHKDHRSHRSSSMYTPKAWQIRTKMDPARFSHWQMTGSYNIKGLQGGSRSSATAAGLRVPVVSQHQSRQGTDIVVLSWQQSSRQSKSSEIHGIHFDRILTYRKDVETTGLKHKKRQSVLKAMAAMAIEERHHFLLYQSVVLRVID